MFERTKNLVLKYGSEMTLFTLIGASIYDFCKGNYSRALIECGLGLSLYESVNYKFSQIDKETDRIERLTKILEEKKKVQEETAKQQKQDADRLKIEELRIQEISDYQKEVMSAIRESRDLLDEGDPRVSRLFSYLDNTVDKDSEVN